MIRSNSIDGTKPDGVDIWEKMYGMRIMSVRVEGLSFVSNVISNVDIGLLHEPSVTSKALITLTDNSLSGTDHAIKVAGPGDIDATGGNIINGIDSETADLDGLFAIEDAIFHKLDDASLGLVRVKAGELHVTSDSGSIQRGVDAADATDTVHVADGLYAENVQIDKAGLVLQGQGAATTTIDAGGSGIVVLVSASNVTVSGFTVTGSGQTDADAGIGLLNVSECHLFDNIVQSNVVGIALAGSSQSKVADNALIGNGNGIALVNLGDVGGPVEMGSKSNVIEGNTILNSGQHGIWVAQNCSNNKLEGNTVVGSVGSGIYLWKAEDTSVWNNVLQSNSYGLEVFGSKNLDATSNILTGNQIGVMLRTGVHGELEPATSSATVQFNWIAGNVQYGINASDNQGHVVHALANWWGDEAGPTHASNPGGGGDAVTDDVLFNPWLADGTNTQPPDEVGFMPVFPLELHYLPKDVAFTVQPQSTMVNAPLATAAQPIVVEILNTEGLRATQYNGSVMLAIEGNPGAPVQGVLKGDTTVTVVDGLATFTNLTIEDGTGSGYTLTATSATLTPATSATFNIGNHTPELTAIGVQSVDERQTLTFTAEATDVNQPVQTLSYSLVAVDGANYPEGADIDSATGEFVWETVEGQGGDSAIEYKVIVRVTDNGSPAESADREVAITVNQVNHAPELSDVPATAEINELSAWTFTATATDSDLPAQTLIFSLMDEPTGALIDSESGAFTWTPSEAQGPAIYTFKVIVTDNGTPNLADTNTVTVSVGEVNHAPVLGPIGSKSINQLTMLAFTATATDEDVPANTLTFSLDATALSNGMNIDSATGAFTWTPTVDQGPGDFPVTITVTDNGDPELSDSEIITITVVGATQYSAGFYSPSESMVVSNTFAYAGELDSLTWTPELPDGWTLNAVAGDADPVLSVAGDAIEFNGSFASNPIVFRYTVNVPGNQSVSNAITATATFKTVSMGAAQTVQATPDPLPVYRYHSADYRAPFRTIDGSEMNRVLSYWRAGFYAMNPDGNDGYMASSTLNQSTVDNGAHSADYTPDGLIDLFELGTVQAFWSSGGYSVNVSLPSGYEPLPAGTGPDSGGPGTLSMSMLGAQAMIPTTSVSGTTYDPGRTVNITCIFTPDSNMLSLGFAVDLPAGWKIQSALSQTPGTMVMVNNAGTEVNLMYNLSVEQVVVLTVSVPLNEYRNVSFGNTAVYYAQGGSGIQTLSAAPVTLSPADADGNGIADSWEDHYAVGGVRMGADEDVDNDGHTTYQEYVTGTVPTDPESVLKMIAVVPLADGTLAIAWQSVAGRSYTLQRSIGGLSSSEFENIAVDIPSDVSGTNVYVEPPGAGGRAFYRVIVEEQK